MKNKVIQKIKGQSLMELIVAIAIGGIIVISIALSITLVLRNDMEAKNVQIAASLSQQDIDNIRVFSQSDWYDIYNLSGGAGKYSVIPTATTSVTSTFITTDVNNESVFTDAPNNGLILHWKFDEHNSTLLSDYSGNGDNGKFVSLLGPLSHSTSGCRAGSCEICSSATGSGLGSNLVINVPQVTISLWIKLDSSLQGTKTFIAGFQNGENSVTYDKDIYLDTDKKLYFYVNDGSGKTTSVPSNIVSFGNWVHVVATADGTNANLYLNGVLIGSVAAGNTYAGYTVPDFFLAGGSFFGNGLANSGSYVDDVRVYNRALSPTEVARLYYSPIFTRYFTMSTVNRDSCGAGNITNLSATACSGPDTAGITSDPSTLLITSYVEWPIGSSFATNGDQLSSYPKATYFNRYTYLTRHNSYTFNQGDWSGGSGQNGPITNSNNKFASSTGINISIQGQIKSSSAATGVLDSSTFDTQSINGESLNFIMWRGTQTRPIQFQIATCNIASDCGNGTAKFVGPDGTSNTFYSPTGEGIPVKIALNPWSLNRYFRYRIYTDGTLAGTSSIINNVVIGWSQ